MVTNCSVCGCPYNKSAKKHRFPNPTHELNRFLEWKKFCRNQKLDNETPMRTYTNRRVCSRHFEEGEYYCNGGKLKKYAVPSIFTVPVNAEVVSNTAKIFPSFIRVPHNITDTNSKSTTALKTVTAAAINSISKQIIV